MDFRLSRHAEWETTRRGIPFALVEAVMEHPEQTFVDESCPGRWIHQSRLRFEDGKPGVILDYDAYGNMVSFEILGFEAHVQSPVRRVRSRAAPAPTGLSKDRAEERAEQIINHLPARQSWRL